MVQAIEVGIFGSALAHAVTLPFHSATPRYAVIVFGQMVALVSLCLLGKRATQWEQAMTAAIVAAFLLPHFVLSRSAIHATTAFLRLPNRRGAHVAVGAAVTAVLALLYQLLIRLSSYLMDEEESEPEVVAPAVSAPALAVRPPSPPPRLPPRRVSFEGDALLLDGPAGLRQ